MNIFGITGWKNSGKTSLVVRLVKILGGRGYSVSTMKNTHHHFDIDQPGKDSFLHRQAGASEVLISSDSRWALLHEFSGESESSMEELIARMSPVDYLLVEGFKQSDHPKIQVIRVENNREQLPDNVTNLVAIASDGDLNPKDYGCNGPLLDLNDEGQIADFIISLSAGANESA